MHKLKQITTSVEFRFSFYSKDMLLEIIAKLYKIQGNNIIKAITRGNSMVQQNDINWSYRILGNEALAQIKINIIIQDFNPNVKPYMAPSIQGLEKKVSYSVSISFTYKYGSISLIKSTR